MIPKIDIKKFRYKLNSEFKIIIKIIIEIRMASIRIEIMNKDFE